MKIDVFWNKNKIFKFSIDRNFWTIEYFALKL